MSTLNDPALTEAALFARVDESELEDTAAKATVPTRTYLTFMIHDSADPQGALKLGVDAEYVVEILSTYSITYLPMMPDYVPGICNMRGQIIPVMDIRLRLDKYGSEGGLLVVLNYNNTQVGILVDEVDRIVSVADQDVVSVPSQDSQRFVSGMFTLEEDASTVLVLDCGELLSHG